MKKTNLNIQPTGAEQFCEMMTLNIYRFAQENKVDAAGVASDIMGRVIMARSIMKGGVER